MRSDRVRALIAAIVLGLSVFATQAKAELISHFSFTGTSTTVGPLKLEWDLPTHFVPQISTATSLLSFFSLPVLVNGVAETANDFLIIFLSALNVFDLGMDGLSVQFEFLSTTNYFTGPFSSPTFVDGTYTNTITNIITAGSTLTITSSDISVVPVPTTLALLGLGLAGLGWSRRKK